MLLIVVSFFGISINLQFSLPYIIDSSRNKKDSNTFLAILESSSINEDDGFIFFVLYCIFLFVEEEEMEGEVVVGVFFIFDDNNAFLRPFGVAIP